MTHRGYTCCTCDLHSVSWPPSMVHWLSQAFTRVAREQATTRPEHQRAEAGGASAGEARVAHRAMQSMSARPRCHCGGDACEYDASSALQQTRFGPSRQQGRRAPAGYARWLPGCRELIPRPTPACTARTSSRTGSRAADAPHVKQPQDTRAPGVAVRGTRAYYQAEAPHFEQVGGIPQTVAPQQSQPSGHRAAQVKPDSWDASIRDDGEEHCGCELMVVALVVVGLPHPDESMCQGSLQRRPGIRGMVVCREEGGD